MGEENILASGVTALKVDAIAGEEGDGRAAVDHHAGGGKRV